MRPIELAERGFDERVIGLAHIVLEKPGSRLGQPAFGEVSS